MSLLVRSALFFSSENDHSDLPYPDDITTGPVPEEASTESISLSPSPASSVAEIPAAQLPRQKLYSERAIVRLNQVQTQLNFLLHGASNPQETERVLNHVRTSNYSNIVKTDPCVADRCPACCPLPWSSSPQPGKSPCKLLLPFLVQFRTFLCCLTTQRTR